MGVTYENCWGLWRTRINRKGFKIISNVCTCGHHHMKGVHLEPHSLLSRWDLLLYLHSYTAVTIQAHGLSLLSLPYCSLPTSLCYCGFWQEYWAVSCSSTLMSSFFKLPCTQLVSAEPVPSFAFRCWWRHPGTRDISAVVLHKRDCVTWSCHNVIWTGQVACVSLVLKSWEREDVLRQDCSIFSHLSSGCYAALFFCFSSWTTGTLWVPHCSIVSST